MLRKINKKGDVTEIIVVLVMFFFLAVSFLAVAFTIDKFKSVITDTALNDTSVSTNIVNSLDTVSTKTIQRGFVMIFAFLIIGIIASAFLIRIHPVFIFIYIIFIALGIFLAVILGNAYQKIIAVEALSDIAAQQTMTNYIMEHIIVIMLAIGALSMIITFSKLFSPGGFVEGLP